MGATEIIFVFVIYLLFFGAKGIPSLAKTMGKAMYQFREARNDIQREIMDSAKDITDSAKEVRREVENAAKLAEKQAKKAQNYVKNPTSSLNKEDSKTDLKSTSGDKSSDASADAPINPHTPSDSISSSGYANGTTSSEDSGDLNTPQEPIT